MRDKIFTVIVMIISLFVVNTIVKATGGEMDGTAVLVVVIIVVYVQLSDEIKKGREGTR